MEENYVSIHDVTKLRKIFKTKKWIDIPNEETVFNNLCRLLNNLNLEQKQLIHELVEKYLWISSNEYGYRFNNLLNEVDSKLLNDCKKIFLFPIIKPEDEAKIKSGSHCIYIFKGLFALNEKYRGIEVSVIEDFDFLRTYRFKVDGSEIIFLIDDFIGSGETFNSTWNEIKKNSTIHIKFISVLSLVIQNEAYNLIEKKMGLFPLYTEIKNKGISDEFFSLEKEEKIKIMRDIEKYIKPGMFSFGYEMSEALITMIRTPDNTFPFFWMKSKINGIELMPPFPRD